MYIITIFVSMCRALLVFKHVKVVHVIWKHRLLSYRQEITFLPRYSLASHCWDREHITACNFWFRTTGRFPWMWDIWSVVCDFHFFPPGGGWTYHEVIYDLWLPPRGGGYSMVKEVVVCHCLSLHSKIGLPWWYAIQIHPQQTVLCTTIQHASWNATLRYGDSMKGEIKVQALGLILHIRSVLYL